MTNASVAQGQSTGIVSRSVAVRFRPGRSILSAALAAILSTGCTAAKLGAVLGVVGAGVKILAHAPDVPQPPDGQAPAPTPEAGIPPCDGHAFSCPHEACTICDDQPGDREKIGLASTTCVRRVLVTCPTPTPSPTRTPNVSVTPTPTPEPRWCGGGDYATSPRGDCDCMWFSLDHSCGGFRTHHCTEPTPPACLEGEEPWRDRCLDSPWRCVPKSSPTPSPTPSPVPPPPEPTSTPTPGATATPAPPECAAAPEPPLDRPVSLLRQGGRCPRGFDPVDHVPPLCVARSVCHEPGKTRPGTDEPVCPGIGSWWAWSVEAALNGGAWRLSPEGYVWDGGRGWYDAYARVWRSHDVDMPSAPPEGAPTYGLRDPDGTEHNGPGYQGDGPGFIGVSPPLRCAATPTPAPTVGTPTPRPTPNTSCLPVSRAGHWIAGGGHCHAWHVLGDGRIYCVLDSTIRPICDEEHLDNWNSDVCGRRSHDPDYDHVSGAQEWTITGAEDRGPNCGSVAEPGCMNSAQRVIVGDQGAHVGVRVCLRDNAVTADGCEIPRAGDGCNQPTEFDLPKAGDP